MRLYLSGMKEVDALKDALRNAKPQEQETRRIQLEILERVVLCEKLQESHNRADKNK